MKKNTMMMLMAALMLVSGGSASAADNNSYANEPPAPMRNALQNERPDFRNEWRKRPGGNEKDSRRCGPEAAMKDALGLSDTQQKKLQELREKQFASTAGEHSQLRSLQQEIMNESLKKNPDNRRIAMLSKKIGDTHTELARKRSSHLREMLSLLTPDQMEKMKTFMQNRPGGKHGGMML